jgi:excisionase family DNA binding protein
MQARAVPAMDALTISEAATYLRISQSMIRKLMKQGLPYLALGRRRIRLGSR